VHSGGGGDDEAQERHHQEMLDMNALDSDVAHLSEDVLRERQHAHTTFPSDAHPIILRDLRKLFPPVDGNLEKVAVSNLSLAVSSGECFGCVCFIHHCGVLVCMQRALCLRLESVAQAWVCVDTATDLVALCGAACASSVSASVCVHQPAS
jgi:hypothetical protein